MNTANVPCPSIPGRRCPAIIAQTRHHTACAWYRKCNIAENLVNLLWPTKFLALGTPTLSVGGVIVLALTNTILYALIGGLAVATITILKIRPRYAFQLLIL